MVKLCHICDKANVPHHVIDDIVSLLQECKINNIQLQPEKLLKRNNFLKHLEKHFYSPVPQSVVVDLESFTSNDIHHIIREQENASTAIEQLNVNNISFC